MCFFWEQDKRPPDKSPLTKSPPIIMKSKMFWFFLYTFFYIDGDIRYRITGNFCGFGLKRRHFIMADFFSADCKSRHWKKKFVLQQVKRCYDKQLVHITVILRSKNIFSSLESFQMLQLLNTHLVNFKFVLRN
jgi:hypothetical protein